jgi:hypothetical protein
MVVMSPLASWLFFKARATSISKIDMWGASNAEKQPTRHGPKGCAENGPAAALFVGCISLSDMRSPHALPAAHFERNDITTIRKTVHFDHNLRFGENR